MKNLVLILSIAAISGCKTNVSDLNDDIKICQNKTGERCSWVVLPESSIPDIVVIYKKYGLIADDQEQP